VTPRLTALVDFGAQRLGRRTMYVRYSPCARAANGHAVAPPTSTMSSRRLMRLAEAYHIGEGLLCGTAIHPGEMALRVIHVVLAAPARCRLCRQ
jgi:hypothetical protein